MLFLTMERLAGCHVTFRDYLGFWRDLDIFEPAIFSFRLQKFPRPHVAYSNRTRLSTRIRWYPDSLLRNQAYKLCRHIGLLFGKRLDTIQLRHRIRKYPDSPSTRYRIRCAIIFFSTLESGLKNIRVRCRIRRMRVDGGRIRKEKAADSKISGYVWLKSFYRLVSFRVRLFFFN